VSAARRHHHLLDLFRQSLDPRGSAFEWLSSCRPRALNSANRYIDGKLGGLLEIARAFGASPFGGATITVPPLEGLLAWVVRTLGMLVGHVSIKNLVGHSVIMNSGSDRRQFRPQSNSPATRPPLRFASDAPCD
jgi:hypothetical protein